MIIKPVQNQGNNIIARVLIVVCLDLIAIVILVFLLKDMDKKSLEAKKLKSLASKSAQVDTNLIQLELNSSKDKADKLIMVFPDEQGLVNFVREIDKLKKDNLLTRFSFASDNIVKDKTGYSGLPFIIECQGNWQELNSALTNLYRMPYAIRAINVEIIQNSGDDKLSLKFGGILYVNQKFGSN